MSIDFDERIERVRTALVGLAPDQSERLVRMLELGAMVCLIEASALECALMGAPPSSRRAELRRRRTRQRPPLRPLLNAGAT